MIRAAIIGLGTWGQNLVRSVQGHSSSIQFTTAATRDVDKGRAVAQAHGLRLLASYDDVLRDPDVDAVVLATPHSLHTDQIVAAARAGKHVFSEKPLGLDAESAQRAATACADHGVTLGVGYNWRHQPALQRIRQLLDDGTLGRVLHIEGNFCGPSAYRFPRGHWRHDREEVPAGGMTGRGVHVIDAMLYLAGPIGQVTAQSYRLAQDFGVDDTTSMLLRFDSGATGYLGTVIATAETWRLQVFGSNGWAEVGDVEHLHTWELKVCLVDRANVTVKQRPQVHTFPVTSTERAELEHFAQAAAARRPLSVPGGDAVHNVAVLQAILQSAQTQQPVRLA
ncbi:MULTISPECIES: Gfo/Idh/MocA family protein [Ramlibacter]|uniref:Gfo/Idh/MocA family oxidoreductase n=1 Tax=Ramlibacter pinisoli TaxID=2682844 RepID=A0A6N8IVP0_9BURK|nr:MULTISPECIES: Gfo/Idh/MocA family oxidoreductase [Ramlibacter]MBA2961095.1 Gfo/Idh/MocA family oxidoreductase [Ramlibacter sp. CGMCC 1.13660]MVQ31039.1 gfo/Idh/MocA family oxidoreductase [Ramlibacter pinisoli]